MKDLLFRILVFVPLFGSTLNFLPIPPYWFEEINRYWATYYLLHHLLALALLAVVGRRFGERALKYGALLLVVCSCGYVRNFWPIWGAARPQLDELGAQAADIANPQQFKLMHVAWERAGDSHELMRMLAEESPNILALSGVGNALDEEIRRTQKFSTHELIAREDEFGLAIYSTFPVLSLEQTSVGEGLPPVLGLKLGLNRSKPLTLVVFKGLSPFHEHDYHLNRLVVRRFSTQYRHGHDKLIVVGNLEAPHSSYAYVRLQKAGAFQDAQQGFGPLRTWDARRPWLRLTLDHLLYRGRMITTDFRVRSLAGLSHKALLSTFQYLNEE